jgi:FkbM family methyltransferase
MIKPVIKKIFDYLGYVIVTKKRFKTLEAMPYNLSIDFHFLLKKIIKKSDSIKFFDIGANIGQTSFKIVHYFPNAEVYAFEPIKNTYDQLVKNTLALKNIKTYQKAIGSEAGEFTIYHRTNSEWNSLVKELNSSARDENASSEKVIVTTVDKFISENNIKKIDILKSDTEGFEIQVLKGAEKALKSQLIDIIYIEVGFLKGDLQHTNWNEVTNYLEDYGYYFCGLFELSYGINLRPCYGNALFMSDSRLKINKVDYF